MSPSALPPHTRTSIVSQKISSLREALRIPLKRSRNDHANMNVESDDQRHNNLYNNLAEFGQSHPYGKKSTKAYMSQPMLGLGSGVGDVDDVAGRHSIDYPGLPRHEDCISSESPTPAKSSTPLKTSPPTRTLGNSRVRLTPSDATRLRHVPRGPVARVHPTMPPTIIKDKSRQIHQNPLGDSKSISDALLSGTQTGLAFLGIDVGVGVGGTGASRTKLDTSHGVVEGSAETRRTRAEPISHGPGCNASLAIPIAKAKQESPTLPSRHDNIRQIRPLASPPHHDVNKSPIYFKNELQCSSSVSTGSLQSDGHSKPVQGNSDWEVRPLVRPLPALPGGSFNGTGSASMSDGSTKQLIGEPSPPPSSTPVSNDSLMSPHKIDLTGFRTMNKNNLTATPRPPTRSITQNPQLRISPQGKMTNDNQSEDDTPTPTIPFPTPRRAMTIGIQPLSRDAKPLSLSIPPLDRSRSLRGFMEGTARFSPSVIIRPPPLPLVNLPVLMPPSTNRATVAGAEGSQADHGQDEKRRTRVMMSMPALPLQGSSRGTRGHEEVDDLEEDDEEDEEGEEDEVHGVNEGVSGQGSASSSSHIETPRSSFDSETSKDVGDVVEKRLAPSHSSQTVSTMSSYETARAEPSPSFWGSHSWDADRPPPAEAPSYLKVSPHLSQVNVALSGSGVDFDPSTFLDRKSFGEPNDGSQTWRGVRNDSDHVGVVKGKVKQELGGNFGDVMEDVLTTAKDLSNSKGRGDRGAEVWTSEIGVRSGEGGRPGDGLKVVATPDVKVARSYDSEGLALERRLGAGRARLNPNLGDVKNQVPPRHPLPLRSTAVRAKESTLGVPHTRPKNTLSPPSTMPSGSSKLDRSSRAAGVGIGHHNEMYERASKSLINVHEIETKERVEKMVRDREDEEERRRSGRVMNRDVSSWKRDEGAVSQDKGKRPEEEFSAGGTEQKFLNPDNTLSSGHTRKTANPPESSIHLRRRRSMPTTDPPSYFALFAGIPPGLRQGLKVQPREDEGKERLPSYTNDIFLKAVMPRKVEFSSPGVQAKDRKWRRVLCVLDGTALRVYKRPARSAGVSAIGEWWENKIGVGDPLMDNMHHSSGVGRISTASAGDKREPGGALAKEIELARARKSREGGTDPQPVLQINNTNRPMDRLRSHSPLPKSQGQSQQHPSNVSHGVTKSALTLVQLLKPSATRHARSNSEASGPSRSSSRPRTASITIPRSSTSGRTTPGTARTSNDGSRSAQSHLPATVSTIPVGQSQPLTSQSSVSCNNNIKEKRAEQGDEPDENDLIREYTMQHAESGLGKDYTKRQHVIRVRLEGEQFLLQAKNVEGVIAWIEGLQCAANVALDLDERPMPTGPLIPRRRRRRRAAPAIAANSSNS